MEHENNQFRGNITRVKMTFSLKGSMIFLSQQFVNGHEYDSYRRAEDSTWEMKSMRNEILKIAIVFDILYRGIDDVLEVSRCTHGRISIRIMILKFMPRFIYMLVANSFRWLHKCLWFSLRPILFTCSIRSTRSKENGPLCGLWTDWLGYATRRS